MHCTAYAHAEYCVSQCSALPFLTLSHILYNAVHFIGRCTALHTPMKSTAETIAPKWFFVACE